MRSHIINALILVLLVALTSNMIIVQAKLNNKYEEWLAKHTFKVHYVAHYSYDATKNYLNVRVTFKVLKGLKKELIGLEVTDLEFEVNITKYGGLNETIRRFPKRLQLNKDELSLLTKNGVLIKSLGDGEEIITTEYEPPNWWESPPYLPRFTWSYDNGVYVVADPINIIFKTSQEYAHKLLNYILEELRDKGQVDDKGTDDDWPEPTAALSLYIYNYTTKQWDPQDVQVVEGDDEVWLGRDEWDRMHVRLWFIFSPAHGYVVVGNVHLENGAIPEHEIIHIDNDYSYGYEYAEDVFACEFSGTCNGRAFWWHWDGSSWHSSESYNGSLGDCITSYYVFIDVFIDYHSWDVWPDHIDLNNGMYSGKIFGDGLATVITL